MAMEVGVTEASEQYTVYLEIGQKRTFAAAIDWPGWARSGRDEEAALRALMDYASRYAHVLRRKMLDALSTAQGVAPPSGPRGGKRWPWRYFVRRVAWHALDHAWEIEDRST